MQFLYVYRKRYWKPFIAAIAFLTLEVICDLLLPSILAEIIDVGLANQQMDFVLRMGGLMLLITIVGVVSASIRNILASHVSHKLTAELRSDLFKKIQSLSFENLDKFDRAALITRLTSDVAQVQGFVNSLMRIFAKAPLLCIGSLIMAARLNSQLSLVLVVVVPIVGCFIFMNMRMGFPFFIKVQQALDRVNSVMREYLSGVRVVRAFNRFDYEVDKFDQANQQYQARSTIAMQAMAIFGPAITLTVNLGIVAVIWLGGVQLSNGDMQVGHIIAFVNYMTQILLALMMITMVFNMFVRAKASTGRINEIFILENGMAAHDQQVYTATIKGRVDFEQVSFAYAAESGRPVIKNLTMTCLPGETVGIIGSTGSGKSSLVSLIPRFYDASSGTVRVNGQDVKKLDPKKLREKIAIVPQKTMLFTGTILENICFGKEDATMEEVERAARMADAHDFVSSFTDGYETVLGQHGVNLSGGQKQRVSIARALVRQPEILILDDCTSAVDFTTEANIKRALNMYAKNLTCLIIAQRISSVMDADTIIVLDQGQIVGTGKHDELMKSCEVYQEIFHSQMGKELHQHVADK